MLAGLDPRMTDEERDAGSGGGGRTGVGLATKPLAKTAKPALYKVLMLNDDYTPMEFVVLTLQRFFKMSIEDATRVMLHPAACPEDRPDPAVLATFAAALQAWGGG